jgi:hypothetical protein
MSYIEKAYNLRVLAYTLDNGFLAPSVFQNTRRVAEHLDVDYVIVKPRFELMRRVFVASCRLTSTRREPWSAGAASAIRAPP